MHREKEENKSTRCDDLLIDLLMNNKPESGENRRGRDCVMDESSSSSSQRKASGRSKSHCKPDPGFLVLVSAVVESN